MKFHLSVFLIFYCIAISAQTTFQIELKKIEAENKSQMMYGSTRESIIDFDNDGDNDYLFVFTCGESRCINVYANVNGYLKKLVSETGYSTNVYPDPTGKKLTITYSGCCGDHFASSNVTYQFTKDAASIIENYSQSEFMQLPRFYAKSPYQVTILNQDYNLRFSPDAAEKQPAKPGGVLEPQTNIIAKLPAHISVRVLSELVENEDRTWLYIETLNKDLNKKKNSVELFNDQQNLRGWISGKYVKKE